MNKEILQKIDEIIDSISQSDTYQKYLLLKNKLNDNQEIMLLINEIKVLQKDIVHHYQKQDQLEEKLKELNDFPLYREYNNTLIELNNLYAIIETSINNYFSSKLN